MREHELDALSTSPSYAPSPTPSPLPSPLPTPTPAPLLLTAGEVKDLKTLADGIIAPTIRNLEHLTEKLEF